MEEKNTNHFGEHLTIDGYGGSFKQLNDKDLVLKVLNDLPSALEMKKLIIPEVHYAAGNNIKDPGGWSGFVVIEESHISIHTFPATGFISADVYTCKNGMDSKFIENYFQKAFSLADIEVNFIRRGLKYPSLVAL